MPWIAGFSSSFVQDCLHRFLPGGPHGRATVLDPFAGVGTTLVEAVLAGHDAVGFEINPYAVLACRAKLSCARVDLTTFEDACRRYEDSAPAPRGSARPEGFRSRIPFFSPAVEEQVLGLLAYIEGLEDEAVRDLFRVAFGAVMVSFSNYTYEPSLGSRPGAGKPLVEDADVRGTLLARLRQMAEDVRWAQERGPAGRGAVHHRDFLRSPGALAPGSIDLVVTSPPYLNNYHYVRNTRPQLYWLSLVSSPEELKPLEDANFGKYWQTVRGAEPVALEFEHPALAALLEDLRRTRPDKGAYGGPGWANYVTSYLNDCRRFAVRLAEVLRPGGAAVVVIGNSIIQGHEFRVDELLGELAEGAGLALEGIQVLRTKRVGASITRSSVRRGEESRASLYESMVVLRKSS